LLGFTLLCLNSFRQAKYIFAIYIKIDTDTLLLQAKALKPAFAEYAKNSVSDICLSFLTSFFEKKRVLCGIDIRNAYKIQALVRLTTCLFEIKTG